MQTGRGRRLYPITVVCALVLTLCAAASAAGQAPGVYTGNGVAAISGGNVSGARLLALEDARQKAVLLAVADVVPLEDLRTYFLALSNLFFSKPDTYLERFRITGEYPLVDTYRVCVDAVVDIGRLRTDLATVGVLGSTGTMVPVAVIMDEVAPDVSGTPGHIPPQSPPGFPAVPATRTQHLTETHFRAQGARIVAVSPDGAEAIRARLLEGGAPEAEMLYRIADQARARILVVGRARLQRVTEDTLASIASVQCSIEATVVDAGRREMLLQTTTYALGTHTDETAAAAAAIDDAARNLTGGILERLYTQLRTRGEYSLQLTFAEPVAGPAVRQFLVSLQTALGEIAWDAPVAGDDARHWRVPARSTARSAALLQRLYEGGVPGYEITVAAVQGRSISLVVTPRPEQSGDQAGGTLQ